MTRLTVSQLADHVGASADTIRYYDRIGLLADVDRNVQGHRVFGPEDVERLRFIQRAQAFGLRLDEVRELLDVRDRGLCPCGHARDLLQQRAEEVGAQIRQLQTLEADIRGLLDDGRAGDGWPCTPTLLQLAPPPRRRRAD